MVVASGFRVLSLPALRASNFQARRGLSYSRHCGKSAANDVNFKGLKRWDEGRWGVGNMHQYSEVYTEDPLTHLPSSNLLSPLTTGCLVLDMGNGGLGYRDHQKPQTLPKETTIKIGLIQGALKSGHGGPCCSLIRSPISPLMQNLRAKVIWVTLTLHSKPLKP